MGDLAEAEADVLAALAADPGGIEAWQVLAQVTARSQHYATALDAVDAALAHDPWNTGLLLWRAQVATGRDEHRALASWRQLDALGEPVLRQLAVSSAALGGDAALIPRLERAGLSDALALQHLALGDPERAASLTPDCQVRAECLARGGDLDAALTTLAHCDAADRSARQVAHARWDPAQLDVLLQGTPQDPGLLRLRAESALETGDFDGALAAARTLDSDDPHQPVLEGLALSGQGTASLDVLAQAYQRQPGDARVLVALGSAQLTAGDPAGRVLIDRGMRYGSAADLVQWDLSPKGAP
jgi:tetratricopeptide (TPR) repeat protein